jgi:hypothetical protein
VLLAGAAGWCRCWCGCCWLVPVLVLVVARGHPKNAIKKSLKILKTKIKCSK